MNLFTTERNNYRRRLIILVKKHPILWNKTQEDYKRNRPQKMQTWQEIAEQMGASADKIRRTWENLRDQYRRDLKREMKYGYISKWRFFYDMNFIRDMVTCKESQNELTDSDSELETSELSQFLHEALEPNAQFVEPRPVANQESNHTVSTPNITEFHPIVLSKRWQKVPDNQEHSTLTMVPKIVKIPEVNPAVNPNPGPEECLQTYDRSKNYHTNQEMHQTPSTLTFTEQCDSSRNMNQAPAPIPEDLEFVTKTEPESDIKLEPTRAAPIPPLCPINTIIHLESPTEYENFQESYVSTSSQKRAGHLPSEEPVELRTCAPLKKRKSSDSESDSKDEDYYFVMSLLPSLRQIPRNKKFALRIGLMNLIAKDLEDVCK